MVFWSRKRVCWVGLLFPPAAFVLLWREQGTGLARKLWRSVWLGLYSLCYAVLIILLLMQFAGLELEWRGGFPPVLTFSKAKPDYDALEVHRAGQAHQIASASPGQAMSGGTYWIGFRGPHRDGHYAEQAILTNWPAGGLRSFWRQPVGGGYASFAVAEGMAFTMEQRRDEEVVTAYAVATGRELWAHGYRASFDDTMHMGGVGPRSTPTWHLGRLYALGATGRFMCFEARTGRLLWVHNILEEENAQNLQYGCAASPLIVEDKVIVVGGQGEKSLLAYDLETGQPVWKSVSRKPAYSSPMLVELTGQRQILLVTAKHAVGVEPEDGFVLWEFPWTVQYDNNIAQPVVLSSNRFFLSAGYGTGCVAVELEKNGSEFIARELWRNRLLKNKLTSSVFYEGHIYGLDEDILTCLDAATGRRMWKEGRYGYGQLVLASGHLVILSGFGDLVLVKASPERYEELARFPALEGKTWNHPALADGCLLVRNAAGMMCFQVGAE
jgi:outer membrane protein assembly factor BamB